MADTETQNILSKGINMSQFTNYLIIYKVLIDRSAPKIKAGRKGPWVKRPDIKCAAILNLEMVNNISMKYASRKGNFFPLHGPQGDPKLFSVFELCPGRVPALQLLRVCRRNAG